MLQNVLQIGLSPAQTGFMFLISAGIYAAMSPIIGNISDKRSPQYRRKLMVIGAFLLVIGFLLMGPSPMLPFLKKYIF